MGLLGPLYGGGFWVAFRQLALVTSCCCHRHQHCCFWACFDHWRLTTWASAGASYPPPRVYKESLLLGRWLQVYYAAAVVLHYVVPACMPVHSVQKGQRRRGQVTFEALYSLGMLPPGFPSCALIAACTPWPCKAACMCKQPMPGVPGRPAGSAWLPVVLTDTCAMHLGGTAQAHWL